MATNSDTLRQSLHELADQLPADATWDDVIDEVRFRKAVGAGLATADRGTFSSEDEVKAAFARWNVSESKEKTNERQD